jgi:hypothetical protein
MGEILLMRFDYAGRTEFGQWIINLVVIGCE